VANVVLTKAIGFTQCEIGEAVSKALDTLNYDLNDKINSVIIKPNLCYYWDYSTGETTDPRVVSAVIDWVRQRTKKEICIFVAEADASAMMTKYVFKMLGYEKLSQQKNVKLFNLSEGEIIDKEVVVAGEKIILPINRILLSSDLIINVPKIKYHRTIGFTCALKNMFGAISKPRKYVYHNNLPNIIVGVNKIIKTNIVLADGIIVAGKTPKKTGVIMASDDALVADLVAARIMGYNPSRIAYLKLAMKEKIGNTDNINLIENLVKLESIKKELPNHNYLLKKISWKMQLELLKLYSKISQDVIPPILSEA
jgi:uncharacterized protein (DUF362 family)